MMKNSIYQKYMTIINFYVSNRALNKVKFDKLHRETNNLIVKGKYINVSQKGTQKADKMSRYKRFG